MPHGRLQTTGTGQALRVHVEPLGEFQDENRWNHYKYRFHYFNPETGGTWSITWRCGMAYGQPKWWDGLSGAFLDARFLEDEYESVALKERSQIERTTARLRTFLGDDWEPWERYCQRMEEAE